MWTGEVHCADAQGDVRTPMVLSSAHGCRLPDLIVRTVPLDLPWILPEFPFEEILKLAWSLRHWYNAASAASSGEGNGRKFIGISGSSWCSSPGAGNGRKSIGMSGSMRAGLAPG